MSKTTRRKMGVSAFVTLAVLGTGWVVERASSNAHMQGGAAISESVSASEAAIVPVFQPPVTNSSEQYDRSDLLLSQGQIAGSSKLPAAERSIENMLALGGGIFRQVCVLGAAGSESVQRHKPHQISIRFRATGLAWRRAIVTALVIALTLTAGVALLDQPNPVRSPSSRSSAVDRGRKPERRMKAGTETRASTHTADAVGEIGPDRYAVSLGSPNGWLPRIAKSVQVRPAFDGFRITSEIGDRILTAEGLIVTDPKLSASVGLEPGDRVRAINGHPLAGGAFLALIKLRRDPDSGALRLDVERGGQRLERVVVIR